jgi:Tfp pilus assembly protein PilV
MFKWHEQAAASRKTARSFLARGAPVDDRGVTLIETMFAVALCLIGVFGVGNVIYVATAANKNQGTETTRATIYAQDKIEKLLSLASVPVSGVTTASFSNCTQPASTQLASYADCNTTGITASGWATGLLAGGAISPLPTSCGSALAGYTDYLDASGNKLTGASCSSATANGFSYVRMWQISDVNTFGSTPALKQITVAVYSMSAVDTAISSSHSAVPLAVLTSYVSDPN